MDDTTRARINLNAVLRALEQLPALDAPAASLVAGERQTIQFTAPRVATVRVVLGGGAIGTTPAPGRTRSACCSRPRSSSTGCSTAPGRRSPRGASPG